MRFLRRLILVLGSLACGLALANWVLWRWFPLPVVMYRADPELIYSAIPGTRVVKSIPSEGKRRWVTSEINSRGFRGRELRVPKRGPRIAVYGDSFVFAEEVPLEETFVERLGVALAPDDPPEMVNAGVIGYGPDQACVRFEKEARELAPDLVVLVLYAGNDYGDLLRDKLFRLDSSERAIPNRIVLARDVLADFDNWDRAASQPALLRLFRTFRDELSERARQEREGPDSGQIERFLVFCREDYEDYLAQGPATVRRVWGDYYDIDLALHPEWESSGLKLRLMRAVLARMRDDCERLSVPFVALVVPAPHDTWTGFHIRIDPAQYPGWSPTRLTGELARILADLHVPFLDFYDDFREGDAGRYFVGRENVHWNSAGQELAARKTAALLAERGLWPPKAAR